MTDDVRAAVEFDEEVFAVMCSEPLTLLCTSSGTGIATVHGDDRNDRERTAHWLADRLNGEAARTAAAVAAAREEQRAEDMLSLGREEQSSWAAFRIKAAPLTATPLADELRDEREVSQSLREQLIAAEAERDALRAQLAAETNLYKASMAEASRAIEGLTAQVKAARAKTKEEEARRVELLLLTPCASEDYKEGVRQAAAKIRSERTFTTLDAMDGAKP